MPWLDNHTPMAWLQSDGKIMAILPHTAGMSVLRLNIDGSPDDSLAPGGRRFFEEASIVDSSDPWLRVPGTCYATLQTLDPVAGGGATIYFNVDRYERHGVSSELLEVRLDASWNLAERHVVVQSELGGGPVTLAWTPDRKLLAVFNDEMIQLGPDGQPDASYGTKPFASSRYWSSAAVDRNGKIIVVSDERPGDPMPIGGIQRLNADGAPDPTFAGGQMAFGLQPGVDFRSRPLVLKDGSIILGGTFDGPWFSKAGMLELAKVMPDGGTPDTFNLKAHGMAPIEYDTFATDANSNANATDDPTDGFGLLADNGEGALSEPDKGLFADVPGMSVFNPSGRRDVFDGSGEV
jgi:hypothetical protein